MFLWVIFEKFHIQRHFSGALGKYKLCEIKSYVCDIEIKTNRLDSLIPPFSRVILFMSEPIAIGTLSPRVCILHAALSQVSGAQDSSCHMIMYRASCGAKRNAFGYDTPCSILRVEASE